MRLQLKTVNDQGRLEVLDFQGFDRATAVEQAESRGYTVLAVHERRGLALPWRAAQQRFPVALFSQELLVLLNAGLPLVEALATLGERERRDDFRGMIERITAVVRQGNAFSAALAQFPRAFSSLYVAIVQASEKTSDLAPALSRYVAYHNQIDAIRKRLVNAAIYPSLLIGVGGLVTFFLLLYVVPRFSQIYEERGTELPFFSKILFAWGQLVAGHGTVVAAAAAGMVAAAVWALRRPAVRARLEALLWRVPGVGERIKVYQLARFYRTTGTLLGGGVPLLGALRMGRDLLHPVLRDRLDAAGRAINEGRPVAESMDANGLTTPVALRLLAVGESSGNMGEMMDRIAAFHDEEISRWVDWATRLFEPILMAAIGLVIGAIVVLMYMPIFELAGSLQ